MAVVLVVDDEAMIRGLAEKVLKKGGHSVVMAENGEDAIAVFSEQGGAFSIVVLDFSLPGISGTDLLRKLRAIRPDIPCIFSSGFPMTMADVPEDIRSETSFLQKPYRSGELLDAVRQSLTPAG